MAITPTEFNPRFSALTELNPTYAALQDELRELNERVVEDPSLPSRPIATATELVQGLVNGPLYPDLNPNDDLPPPYELSDSLYPELPSPSRSPSPSINGGEYQFVEFVEKDLATALNQLDSTFVGDFNSLELAIDPIFLFVEYQTKQFKKETSSFGYQTILAQARTLIEQVRKHSTLDPFRKKQVEIAFRASLSGVALEKGMEAIGQLKTSKEEIVAFANTLYRDVFNFATDKGAFQAVEIAQLDHLLDAVIQKCDLKDQFNKTGSIGINRRGFSRLTQGISSKTPLTRLIEKLKPIAGKKSVPMSVFQDISGCKDEPADQTFNRLRRELDLNKGGVFDFLTNQTNQLITHKRATLDQLEALLPKAPVAELPVEPSAPPLRRPGIAVSSPSWLNFHSQAESTEDAEIIYNGLSSYIQRDLIRHIYRAGIEGSLETRVSELFKRRTEDGKANGLYCLELHKLNEKIGAPAEAAKAGEDLLAHYYDGNAIREENKAQFLHDLGALIPKITSEPLQVDQLHGYMAELASPAHTRGHSDLDASLFTKDWARDNFVNPNYRSFVIQAIERFLHERA